MSSELYLYFLILPFIGAAIPLFWMRNSYDEAIRDPNLRMKLEEPLAVVAGPYSGKKVKDGLKAWLNIFKGLSIGILFYGLVGFVLVKGRLDDYTGPIEVADAIVSSAGIALGLACLGAGIGMGLALKEAVRELMTRAKSWTWYLIHMALTGGISLYGLAAMFMILGKLEKISVASAEALYGSTLIFGAMLLLSGVLVGSLPTSTDVAIGEMEWTAKIRVATLGFSPAILGLAYEVIVLSRI